MISTYSEAYYNWVFFLWPHANYYAQSCDCAYYWYVVVCDKTNTFRPFLEFSWQSACEPLSSCDRPFFQRYLDFLLLTTLNPCIRVSLLCMGQKRRWLGTMVTVHLQFFCYFVRCGWNCWGRVVDFLLNYNRHYSWRHPWGSSRFFVFRFPLHPCRWCMVLAFFCGVPIFHTCNNLICSGYNLLYTTTTSIISVV